MSQYILIDNYGSTMRFQTLNSAITFMRNSGKNDSKFFARLYEAKEVFNSDCFDMKSIIENENG